jgi:DNA processing protein
MPPVPRHLTPSERIDWLRLIRSENVGPVTFYQLLSRFGTAQAALEALPEIARRGGRQRPLAIASKAAAERELAHVAKAGAQLVAWGEPLYPSALAAIDDAPPLLSVRGQTQLLSRPAVAVVGARNASANGRRFARDIALQLGSRGLVVVSGLARGIDAAAHEGALPSGTVAVLAGGIDTVYPEENRELHESIAERGVLVAEMPVGTTAQARHFPRRNRIISGLSLGVLVVEAAVGSGSLITARFALDQGREVFAVPGSPLDPRCKGTNDLIRKGARMVESADDVIEELRPALEVPLAERRRDLFAGRAAGIPGEAELESARAQVLELLSPSPLPVDELVRECQMSPAVVVTVLLELELAGRIERLPGNQVALL